MWTPGESSWGLSHHLLGTSEECGDCPSRSGDHGLPHEAWPRGPLRTEWRMECSTAEQGLLLQPQMHLMPLSCLLLFFSIHIHSPVWTSAVSPGNESLLCCVLKSLFIVMDLCHVRHSGAAVTSRGDLSWETGNTVWMGKASAIFRSSPDCQRCVLITQWIRQYFIPLLNYSQTHEYA